MSFTIRPERVEDEASIFRVHASAFGQEDEGRLVDQLRSGGYAQVGLVAEEEGQVVGHILFSRLTLRSSSRTQEGLALAPLAVVPTHQRRGIGSALIREGLRVCSDAGHRIVIVLGHPEFYERFGFSAALAERLKSPYAGPAFMALELAPHAIGVEAWEVTYPPPFESL